MDNNRNKETSGQSSQLGENAFKQDADRKYSDEARGVAEVNVKNANAAGDGSLERKDESLPSNDSSKNTQID
jgi:hypothetical protein